MSMHHAARGHESSGALTHTREKHEHVPCCATNIQSVRIGAVVFLRKFNDFTGRRGHVPKWCTVRSYDSVANALICAKGAMPVSRGLPLIVVYALYYAILLYALSSAGYSICTDLYVYLYRWIHVPVGIHPHNNLYLREPVPLCVSTVCVRVTASKYKCYHFGK